MIFDHRPVSILSGGKVSAANPQEPIGRLMDRCPRNVTPCLFLTFFIHITRVNYSFENMY